MIWFDLYFSSDNIRVQDKGMYIREEKHEVSYHMTTCLVVCHLGYGNVCFAVLTFIYVCKHMYVY